MNLKAGTALLTGGMAYIITVIIGLLLRQPLAAIFYRGLTSLLVAGMTGWLMVYLLELFSENGEKEATDQVSSAGMGQEEQKNDDFSPLNPPVLEIRENEDE